MVSFGSFALLGAAVLLREAASTQTSTTTVTVSACLSDLTCGQTILVAPVTSTKTVEVTSCPASVSCTALPSTATLPLTTSAGSWHEWSSVESTTGASLWETWSSEPTNSVVTEVSWTGWSDTSSTGPWSVAPGSTPGVSAMSRPDDGVWSDWEQPVATTATLVTPAPGVAWSAVSLNTSPQSAAWTISPQPSMDLQASATTSWSAPVSQSVTNVAAVSTYTGAATPGSQIASGHIGVSLGLTVLLGISFIGRV